MCALAASFAHMKDIGLTTVFLYSEIYWIMCFTYVNFYMPGVLHRENKVLLSNSFSQAQIFLHLIQKEGARRVLVLNFDKCERLALNSTQRVYYDPQSTLQSRLTGFYFHVS